MKPISTYFITPQSILNRLNLMYLIKFPVQTYKLMLFLSLKCLMNRLLMKDLMQTFYMLLVMNI